MSDDIGMHKYNKQRLSMFWLYIDNILNTLIRGVHREMKIRLTL